MEEYIVISKDYLERIKAMIIERGHLGISASLNQRILKAPTAEDVFNAAREEVKRSDPRLGNAWFRKYDAYSDFITSLKPQTDGE